MLTALAGILARMRPRLAGHSPVARRRLAPLAFVVALGLGAWWWSVSQATGAASSLAASGSIEAEDAALACEIAGRVAAIRVEEGQRVKAGDLLVEIDASLLEAQLKQAEAAVDVAKANLALLEDGARPEEVREAEALRAQAAALRDAAKKGWENAKAMRDEPQDLIARLDAAEPQVDSARARLDQVKQGAREADLEAARAALAAARSQLAQVQATSQAREKALSEALEVARAKLVLVQRGPREEDIKAAERALDQARNTLWATQIERDGLKGNPRLPRYQGQAADARVAAAETAVQAAEIQLAKLKAGPTAEEVRVAEAAVAQAEAELAAARAANAPSIEAARAAVVSAEARLRQLEDGATEEDLRIAEAAAQQAERYVADLKGMRERPLALNAQADSAYGQYLAAEAGLKAAEARLEAVKKGPTEQQLKVAREQVRQAEAAASVLQVQVAKARLTAPFDGTITDVMVREGETAIPGGRLLTLTNLDEVTLTVYVP